jgi:hypothetical protein
MPAPMRWCNNAGRQIRSPRLWRDQERISILEVSDRQGETAYFVLQGIGVGQIKYVLKLLIKIDFIICANEAAAYKLIAQRAGIVHRPVNVAAGQRDIGGIYHIHNINAYDSRLKQWMVRFKGVVVHYLESYLGWHRMIDRLGHGITPNACLLSAIGRARQFQQTIAI